MSLQQASSEYAQQPPWHLWAVGLLFLVLHLGGVYDQAMLLSQHAGYFQQQGFGDAQIAYFTDYPLLRALVWITALWGGLIASILLLLRSRFAFAVALIGFAAQVILIIETFGFLNRWQLFGPWLSLFDFSVLFLTVGFVLYCRTMLVRGVLR
ncbi:MAG TPA: hypothetical protein VFS21_14020 [Roseiflexaceae bacterium]|nr:hypothetical protein [Roseiflexaceae bacterium]